MDRYLIDQINRLIDTSDQKIKAGQDSCHAISQKALQEEKLDSKELILQLVEFIGKEKNKRKRNEAYFLLSSIAKDTSENTAVQFLIHRIEQETDKHILDGLLIIIGSLIKPIGTDLKPLIEATKSSKWVIRHSAIQAFKNSKDKIAEKTLIGILEKSLDPYDLIYANATLNHIGTARSIPYLEKHLNSRKRDVKLSAKFAIESIKKRNGIP